MRIRRIRLAHYRGVRAREVVLPPRNVTVIEGPNESGKSSLNEALDVILECYDSSKAARVMDLKPTHEDAGAEIEVDIEAGEYVFTYFKRFHKRPETTLTVHAPRRESLTGREAHERVLAMLGETVDLGLWRALRIQQGLEVDLPQLAGNESLAHALDEAAGQTRGGARETSLLEAVEQEFLRYYTPKEAQPTGALAQAQSELDAARAECESLATRLAAVDADAAACALLEREVEALERQREAGAREAGRHRAARIEAERQRAQVATEQRALDAERARLEAARAEVERRRERAARLARSDRDHARALQEREQRAPTLAAARAKVEQARAGLRKRDEALQAAREASERTRARATALHDERELAQARAALARARALHERCAAHEAELAELRVDDAALERIRAAHVALLTEQARAEDAAAQLELRAKQPLTGRIGGEELRLAAGESARRALARKLHIVLDGVLELTVTPGAGGDRLAQARAQYERTCRDAGQPDLEAAAAAHARGERLRHELALLRDELARTLAGAALDELEARIARLAQRTKGERRPPQDQDLEDARAQAQAADAEREQHERERRDAERELAGLLELCEKLEREEARDGERLAGLESRRSEERAALERAQSDEDDAALAERAAALTAAAAERAAALAAAEQQLAACDPDSAHELADNAERVLARADADLQTARARLADVRGRLGAHLEAGFHDKLGRARAELHRAQLAHDGIARRAAAARRLRETLLRARDAQLAQYRAPLRERIEKLGRLLFGPSFAVELDDGLRIVSRTHGGITVPFRSLSVGTQEQLSIIARLACAMLVARDGGVPVILDDILGYCDPQRLRAMGSMLAVAGRECQIILLTCDPQRGRQVGDAHVVRIAE
jgi:DNA repair exonuclease SbcCD ATPase subunit